MKHFTIMLDMHKSPILGAQSDRFLTGFQFPTSWPTSTCCWHSPQPTIKPPEEKDFSTVSSLPFCKIKMPKLSENIKIMDNNISTFN